MSKFKLYSSSYIVLSRLLHKQRDKDEEEEKGKEENEDSDISDDEEKIPSRKSSLLKVMEEKCPYIDW